MRFFFPGKEGIRDGQEARGLGEVYKGQGLYQKQEAKDYSKNILNKLHNRFLKTGRLLMKPLH